MDEHDWLTRQFQENRARAPRCPGDPGARRVRGTARVPDADRTRQQEVAKAFLAAFEGRQQPRNRRS